MPAAAPAPLAELDDANVVAAAAGGVVATPAPDARRSPLVDITDLNEVLDTVTVLDVRGSAEFAAGHMPGAVSLPVGAIAIEDSSHEALLRLAGSVRETLGTVGVSAERPVVLVDHNDGSAAAALLVCELVGLTDVRVLRGGYDSFLKTVAELQVLPTAAPPTTPTALETRTSTGTVASIDDLVLAWQGAARVVDVRSQLEFEGIVGSPCCAGRGHIPGAVHLDWTSLVDASGQLQSADRVRAEAGQVGIAPDEDIIVYCHNGQRAAIAALALRDAGFTRVRTSLGSWHEWSHRSMPRDLEA